MQKKKITVCSTRSRSLSVILHLFLLVVIVFVHLLVPPHKAFAQIVINEFNVFGSPQFVELLNVSSNPVDVSGWYLDDSGGATYLTVPTLSPVLPDTCLVIQGSMNLNTTSADTIRLFNDTAPPTEASAQLVDSYAYTQIPGSGNSFSRTPDGSGSFVQTSASLGLWNSTLTNCASGASSPTPSPIQTPSLTFTPTPSHSPTLSHTPAPTLTPSFTPTPIATATPTPPPQVYISEVMVDPSSGNEWIEIFNNAPFTQSIEGWFVDDLGGSGSSPVPLHGEIQGYAYVAVDITSSMFNNTGDTVRLLDNLSQEVEVFIYNTSQADVVWGRQSFTSNSFCLQAPSKGTVNNLCVNPTLSPTPTVSPQLSPTPTVSSPNNVYLSELYVNTNSGEHEWVELYNDNRFAVILASWKVRDASGQTILTIQATLDAYRYGVFELTSDRLNNTNEQVLLLNSGGEEVDNFAYETSEKSVSWGRSPSSFATWCMQTPSRDTYNKPCIPDPTATPTPTSDPTNTPTPTKTRTPTPTTRLSVGSQKSAGTSSGGNVLGASSVRGEDAGAVVLNFTPITNQDAPSPVVEELTEIPVIPSGSGLEFFTYLFLAGFCMIVGGFQIAKVWFLYQNSTPVYPDMFG